MVTFICSLPFSIISRKKDKHPTKPSKKSHISFSVNYAIVFEVRIISPNSNILYKS